MRLPWSAVSAGAVVVAIGAAGLIRGAVPESSATTASSAGPIVVTNAYIRPPLPPTDEAAAYFTVYNTTAKPDRLTSVDTGAGATATLHAGAVSTSMSASTLVIPAHSSVSLSAGNGHVMIGGLYGTLAAGDNVTISLQFQNAGPIDVTAKVIPFGQPVPASSVPAGGAGPSSGAHS